MAEDGSACVHCLISRWLEVYVCKVRVNIMIVLTCVNVVGDLVVAGNAVWMDDRFTSSVRK